MYQILSRTINDGFIIVEILSAFSLILGFVLSVYFSTGTYEIRITQPLNKYIIHYVLLYRHMAWYFSFQCVSFLPKIGAATLGLLKSTITFGYVPMLWCPVNGILLDPGPRAAKLLRVCHVLLWNFSLLQDDRTVELNSDFWGVPWVLAEDEDLRLKNVEVTFPVQNKNCSLENLEIAKPLFVL